MGLTNWQLFFQDLQNATVQDGTLSDTEIVTIVRQVSDRLGFKEIGPSNSIQPGEDRIGFLQLGFGVIG